MPVNENGEYSLPFPFSSTREPVWKTRDVRQTDGRGGMQTVKIRVEAKAGEVKPFRQ